MRLLDPDPFGTDTALPVTAFQLVGEECLCFREPGRMRPPVHLQFRKSSLGPRALFGRLRESATRKPTEPPALRDSLRFESATANF